MGTVNRNRVRFLIAGCLALVLLSLTVANIVLASEGEWQVLTPANAPDARSGHTITDVNGRIILFGGLTGGQAEAHGLGLLNDTWEWERLNHNWRKITPETQSPPPRHNHSAATSGDKLYIFFGINVEGVVLSDVWSYNPSTNEWREEHQSGTERPSARYGHTSTSLPNGRIALFGGATESGWADRNLWEYNPSTGEWTKQASMPGVPRYGHGAGEYGGNLYVYGGETPDGLRNDMWRYTSQSNSWERMDIGGQQPAPTADHGSAGLGPLFWVFGGMNDQGGTSPDVWKFDFITYTWTKMRDAPAPLMDTGIVAFAGESTDILAFGGMDSNFQPTGQTFLYEERDDIIPPSTTKSVGTPNYIDAGGNSWVTSATPFALNAVDDSSGVAATYYRYFLAGTVPPSFTLGTSFTISGTDGQYIVQYYSVDGAGNTEPVRSQTEGLDNSPPESWIEGILPYQLNVPFDVPCGATDGTGSGVREMGLWYRYQPHTQAAWTGWARYDGGNPAPFPAPYGNGVYEFYTVAVDNLGNREDIPAEASLSVRVVRTLPGRSVFFYDAGRGTGLWLDYQARQFQFFTPGRVYQVKFGYTSGREGSFTRLEYSDSNMRLSGNFDLNNDFARFTFLDRRSLRTYSLFDLPGLESPY